MPKSKKRKRSFAPEFKAEVVRLAKQGDKSVGQLARELDLTETAVRDWVVRADIDANPRTDGPPTTDEHDELRRLRREVKRLEMESEILRKATAFFAKESS